MENVNHKIGIKDGKVFLANDSDSFYVQVFETRKQLNDFINLLIAARDSCFNDPYGHNAARENASGHI